MIKRRPALVHLLRILGLIYEKNGISLDDLRRSYTKLRFDLCVRQKAEVSVLNCQNPATQRSMMFVKVCKQQIPFITLAMSVPNDNDRLRACDLVCNTLEV
jgi:hypothetical protein